VCETAIIVFDFHHDNSHVLQIRFYRAVANSKSADGVCACAIKSTRGYSMVIEQCRLYGIHMWNIQGLQQKDGRKCKKLNTNNNTK